MNKHLCAPRALCEGTGRMAGISPLPHLAEVGELQGLPHGQVGDVLVQLVHQGDRARHVELAAAVPVVAHLALLAQMPRLVQPPCRPQQPQTSAYCSMQGILRPLSSQSTVLSFQPAPLPAWPCAGSPSAAAATATSDARHFRGEAIRGTADTRVLMKGKACQCTHVVHSRQFASPASICMKRDLPLRGGPIRSVRRP